jgi:hypothetical protein
MSPIQILLRSLLALTLVVLLLLAFAGPCALRR